MWFWILITPQAIYTKNPIQSNKKENPLIALKATREEKKTELTKKRKNSPNGQIVRTKQNPKNGNGVYHWPFVLTECFINCFLFSQIS